MFAVAMASVAAPPVDAAQARASFQVMVALENRLGTSPDIDHPDQATCRSGPGGSAFGADVTVVCGTGAVIDIAPGRPRGAWSPMHGGAYRYVTQVTWADQLWGTVDTYLGAGTVTSWRVVDLSGRKYLELTVGW